jgi:hypothetical protein
MGDLPRYRLEPTANLMVRCPGVCNGSGPEAVLRGLASAPLFLPPPTPLHPGGSWRTWGFGHQVRCFGGDYPSQKPVSILCDYTHGDKACCCSPHGVWRTWGFGHQVRRGYFLVIM